MSVREALGACANYLAGLAAADTGTPQVAQELHDMARAALADDGWRDISTARIAAALCKSGKFETGQGTCAPICMSVLGDARKHPCPHREKVFEKLAKDIADALFPTPPEQSHD